MDQIQFQIVSSINQATSFANNRGILKALLADCIPQDKLHQNVMLYAFDADIVDKLQSSAEKTFSAISAISQIENDFGISKSLAIWSVQTWCYLVGLSDIADAISVFSGSNELIPERQPTNKLETTKIGLGIFRAGCDIPCGDISIESIEKPRLAINYGVGKNPNRIADDQEFVDKVYVRISMGQYLKLYSYETEAHYEFVVSKA